MLMMLLCAFRRFGHVGVALAFTQILVVNQVFIEVFYHDEDSFRVSENSRQYEWGPIRPRLGQGHLYR